MGCIFVTAVCLAAAGVGGALAASPVTRLGSGADEVWILRPQGTVKSVVVFGHGWSTPFPSQWAAWIAHLRARGSVVIYPRYRVSAGDAAGAALAAFRSGIVAAFRYLGPMHTPVIALGKSFGGSAIFDYAAEARLWGAPAPAAVVSIFPALPINGLPRQALAAAVDVEILVGDRDTVAGSGGADAFWNWLAGHPASRKRYIVIRSRPGLAATHDSPQRSDPIARAVFWSPVDALIGRLRRRHASA